MEMVQLTRQRELNQARYGSGGLSTRTRARSGECFLDDGWLLS